MDKNCLTSLTERIYKISLLFPKKDPLRYKTREIATEILEKILKKKISQNPVVLDLEVLDSFLEIVKKQNWVSPKEIEEIQKDYRRIKEEVSKRISRKNLNSRQEKILQILKEKGKIQIWQIKEFFPQVSKRTLRRDFKKLVSLGHVLRTGQGSETFYQIQDE
jgi:Fic family protein